MLQEFIFELLPLKKDLSFGENIKFAACIYRSIFNIECPNSSLAGLQKAFGSVPFKKALERRRHRAIEKVKRNMHTSLLPGLMLKG
jgi:hypothetical protein